MASISLRDYQSAADTFNANNYANMPKNSDWFHVAFLMPKATLTQLQTTLGIENTSGRIHLDNSALSVLVKNIKLPNIAFDVKKLNQYNRVALNITKATYEPVDITFWDDTVGTMTGFWYQYYSYMIQDPNYANFTASENEGLPYPSAFQYSNGNGTAAYSSIYSSSDAWYGEFGLDTAISTQTGLGRNQPFLSAIKIYRFNRPAGVNTTPVYDEFTLINPIIKSCSFSDLDYSKKEFMSESMQVEYETVLYSSGDLLDNEIATWTAVEQRFYDTTPSPLDQASAPAIVGTISNAVSSITSTAASAYEVVTSSGAVIGTSATINATAQASQYGISGAISVPLVIEI